MTILVRERPPLNLSIQIETPSGTVARWGADDSHHPENIPNQLVLSTVMPGGFEQMSCILERDPRISWPDLEELSTITVHGLGGAAIAWQGRLEQQPDTGGQETQVTPQCVGWQSHLSDNNGASMIYIDRSLTAWSGPSVSRQIADIQSGRNVNGALSFQASSDPVSGAPALVFSATFPTPTGTQSVEAWYDAGADNLIAQIRCSNFIQLTGSSWGATTNASPNLFNFWFASDANASSLNGSSGVVAGTSGTTPETINASPAERYAYLEWLNANGTYGTVPAGGPTGGLSVQNLAVIGNHGLAIQTGPSGITPGADDGLLASDIIAHAVGAWAPKLTYTTGATGTIQPSSFVIPQLAFNTPTTAANIIQQAAQYELLDWAVWDNLTFWANPRGQYAQAKNWRARVGPAQLQQTGPNISRIYNGVFVTYTDETGVSQVVGPSQSSALLDTDPENPANQAGINRYASLQMGSSTQAGAIQVGQVFLQEQKELDTSGQASLIGHVMDDRGVYWPAWMVRAGDQISFLDASDSSYRRIVNTSYDDTTATNSIQLDQPPDGLQALLERLSVVISGAGLS